MTDIGKTTLNNFLLQSEECFNKERSFVLIPFDVKQLIEEKQVRLTRMQNNGTSQLIFGPLPQSTYEAPAPISVDTSNHHHIPPHKQQQPFANQHSNGGEFANL